MKSLFVGNLSFQTTESELNDLFKPFGQVGRVNLVKDRETGRARGFAFVEMPNDEEAAKAVAGLDGKQVGGRKKPRARLDSRTAAEARSVFQTKTTGKPPVSRVNLAGRVRGTFTEVAT